MRKGKKLSAIFIIFVALAFCLVVTNNASAALSVSPAYWLTIPASGATNSNFTLNYDGLLIWAVESLTSVDWIKVSPSFGFGGNPVQLTLTADPNPTSNFRIGLVTIVALTDVATISVLQAPSLGSIIQTYNVSVNGSYASSSGAGSYRSGSSVTVSSGYRSGYIFDGWTSSPSVNFDEPYNVTTSFTMPSNNVTATANWTQGTDNASFLTAVPIYVNIPVTVRITTGGERRYYVFTAPATGSYTFESSNQSSGADPMGSLYNSSQSLLDTNDDYSGITPNFRITYNMTSGQTYYIAGHCYSRGTGRYTMTVSGVTAPPTPVITIGAQPQRNTAVTQGSISGSLSVTASVTQSATLSYQWYSNTTDSNIGGAPISGATNSIFTIPTNLTASGSPYYYFCEVRATGGAASIRSNAAIVAVTPEQAPVITIGSHPQRETTVTEGSISGSLSVTANVTQNATLSYQWYSSATDSNTEGASITDATSSIFSIPTNLTVSGSPYYYFCEVRATGGAASVRSNAAIVTVTPGQAPVITIGSHPQRNITVTQGSISDSLSVTASVTQNATLSYQWYSSETDSNTGGDLISGATSSIFPIPTNLAATGSPYYYFCEVGATGGAASIRSNAAIVTVNPASQLPSSLSVSPKQYNFKSVGETKDFTVTNTSQSEWEITGVPDITGWSISAIPLNNTTLRIITAKNTSGSVYEGTVTIRAGNLTDEIKVSQNFAPSITVEPNKWIPSYSGEVKDFTVTTVANQKAWRVKSAPDWVSVTQASDRTLTLKVDAYNPDSVDGGMETVVLSVENNPGEEVIAIINVYRLRFEQSKNLNLEVLYNTITAFVTGNGTISGLVADEEVTLIAIPDKGESFIGWYEYNAFATDPEEKYVLVSTAAMYTFTVTSDREFEARFTSTDATNPPRSGGGGGGGGCSAYTYLALPLLGMFVLRKRR